MDAESIDLLDNVEVGAKIAVTYRVGNTETVATGAYVGPQKNHIGQQCYAIEGARDSRIRIPVSNVVKIERA